MDISAALKSTAIFPCTAEGVDYLSFLVNSKPVGDVVHLGVLASRLVVISGSQLSANLSVPAINELNNCTVVCTTVMLDGERHEDSSPEAHLIIQG